MFKVAVIRSKITAFGRILARMMRFLGLIVDDLLVLSGLAVIIVTNYRVNELFGWYSLGAALVGMGVLFARFSRRRQ